MGAEETSLGKFVSQGPGLTDSERALKKKIERNKMESEKQMQSLKAQKAKQEDSSSDDEGSRFASFNDKKRKRVLSKADLLPQKKLKKFWELRLPEEAMRSK